MKRIIVFMICSILFSLPVSAEELPPLPDGPLVLTSITQEQLSPEFWINRLQNPDALIKTPEELEEFNEDIHMIVRDRIKVLEMPETQSGRPVREAIEREFKALRGRQLWDVKGDQVPKELFNETLKPRLALDNLSKSIKLKWGVAVEATSVRALPTSTKLLEEIGDIEFDQLQFTLIKTWTPVAILHQTKGGSWLYIQAPYARGWVKANQIARFDSKRDLKTYVESKDFITVTGESIPIYLNARFTETSGRVSMGTVLPLAERNPDHYVVWMPLRTKLGGAFIRQSYVDANHDVVEGFLPYTQRNAINQAFKLLGARYGWGGTYKGRDCSGFTHDVFLTFGIQMPRTSGQQSFVGTQLSHFTPFENPVGKATLLKSAAPGITLLRMPMHMMLYLGEIDGNFYIIHSTWAERIGQNKVLDEKRRINQVVVTDMSLNGNSYLGPLFDRVTSINEVA